MTWLYQYRREQYIGGGFVLRQFLLLVRLPNIFTTPTNILTGYFAVVLPSGNVDALQITYLIFSSALLYTAGIVFNDYFDIEIDLRERPNRPLPSKSITTKKALLIGIISLLSSNLLALAVGVNSFAICVVLSAIVIAYDYKLKNTLIGPIVMGSARALNIILGASPALFAAILLNENHILVRIMFVSLSLLAYVFSISLLSRKEIVARGEEHVRENYDANRQIVAISFLIIFAVVISITFAVFLGIFKFELFASLSLFSLIMFFTFRQTNFHDPLTIQNAIKHMVISIVVLDSVFIIGLTGSYYGLLTLVLVPVALLSSKKLYVT
ncbi:MAG: UbiA family prenyltransferase [Nitrososphaeraceae archaeon]|nr:UbiA family prenyltransferase [Nitrososphaeraceae archaeon]